MSDTRHAQIIQALLALDSSLFMAVTRADNPDLRIRGLRSRDLINYVIANMTTSIGQRHAVEIDEGIVRRISEEVTQANQAAEQEAWSRVIEHSITVLDVLPGDPVSFPKGTLPPP